MTFWVSDLLQQSRGTEFITCPRPAQPSAIPIKEQMCCTRGGQGKGHFFLTCLYLFLWETHKKRARSAEGSMHRDFHCGGNYCHGGNTQRLTRYHAYAGFLVPIPMAQSVFKSLATSHDYGWRSETARSLCWQKAPFPSYTYPTAKYETDDSVCGARPRENKGKEGSSFTKVRPNWTFFCSLAHKRETVTHKTLPRCRRFSQISAQVRFGFLLGGPKKHLAFQLNSKRDQIWSRPEELLLGLP